MYNLNHTLGKILLVALRDTTTVKMEVDLRASFGVDLRDFLSHADHILSLCSSLQTSTAEETEYAGLLSEIVADLRVKMKQLNESMVKPVDPPDSYKSEVERAVRAVRTFLSLLEDRLDPGGSHDQSKHTEGPALKWLLKSEEMTELVNQADGLFYRIQDLRDSLER